MPYLETEVKQPLMLESSSLSEVQALPALILDSSLETADDPESPANDDNEDTDAVTCDNEDIVWRTSQYYGIDLVTYSGYNHIV